jgi:PD-(D/E)XK nuclease superfamily
LLIEAKIDANEGEQQLRTYDKWASKNANGREVVRVFLTPEGRASETAQEPWIPLSFLQLACVFRTVFQQQEERPGYHFLRHYLCGVLKDICKWNLPVTDPDTCDDPHNFVEYLKTVGASKEMTS